MFRGSLVLALLIGACGGDDVHHLPDAALHDAANDAAGSGSSAVASIEAHPHDHNLEALVIGLSVVVVAGPVRGARRRRDAI